MHWGNLEPISKLESLCGFVITVQRARWAYAVWSLYFGVGVLSRIVFRTQRAGDGVTATGGSFSNSFELLVFS